MGCQFCCCMWQQVSGCLCCVVSLQVHGLGCSKVVGVPGKLKPDPSALLRRALGTGAALGKANRQCRSCEGRTVVAGYREVAPCCACQPCCICCTGGRAAVCTTPCGECFLEGWVGMACSACSGRAGAFCPSKDAMTSDSGVRSALLQLATLFGFVPAAIGVCGMFHMYALTLHVWGDSGSSGNAHLHVSRCRCADRYMQDYLCRVH